MEFSERLTETRKDRGYTQQSIADALGVERTRYTKWESGKSYPSFDILVSICDLLNISADYLMGMIDEKRYFPNKKPAELADLDVESVTKTNSDPLTPDEVEAVRRLLERQSKD